MFKTAVKSTIKKYESALAAGDKDAAAATYKDAVKIIDKAVAKGIIHKNKAARKKRSVYSCAQQIKRLRLMSVK